jgi:LytS/YehU family sensor histidine kinase
VKVFADDILLAVILYTAIQCVNYVLDFRARLVQQQAETARLNEQLSKAQLDAVRRQIEPHFLFNTLNSVSALVRENRNDAAVMMIAGLSDFLRRLLQDPSRQQVPLAEEMEFAQKYLDIQKVRFVDRLQLSVDVPTDLLVAQVPTLILQLMLENAIKHGISKRAQGGLVRISASRDNGTLTLSVYNDGPLLQSTTNSVPSGIGLTNVRTRLQGLYGDGFALDMRNKQPGGVEVSVSVPFIEH